MRQIMRPSRIPALLRALQKAHSLWDPAIHCKCQRKICIGYRKKKRNFLGSASVVRVISWANTSLAVARQAESRRPGSFTPLTQRQTRNQWNAHCLGYGGEQRTPITGDGYALHAIAYMYKCRIVVHTRGFSQVMRYPHNASATLNLAHFDVQSDTPAQCWSH